MMESLVIFSTLPLNTWSFSRRKYVFFTLLATTAIILPVVSFTVPCKTSSGMARQRLPLVQFEGGRLTPPSRATIGLTNGSLRPCAPNTRGAGLGFSGGFAVVVCVVTLGAGCAGFDGVFVAVAVLG